MKITVNGEKKNYDGPLTVAELLQSLAINPKSVVVEHNLQIVDRSKLEAVLINEGDSVEIIRFVGGG